MATVYNYFELFSAFLRHENYNEVFSTTVKKLSSELNLDSVKSCLILGPGDGQYEALFIKQCVPNISKLIAVEPDNESAERLRARLGKSLPHVDSQVIETSIQSWKGLDDPVDLVVMMHVLYHASPRERKELFKNLQEQWLKPGGRAVVVLNCRTTCPGNVNEIFARLGKPALPWEDTEHDILEAGFTKQHAHEMQCMRDFSTLDEPYLRFYQSQTDQSVTLDDVRNAIKELYPDGKSDQAFHMLAVFQKK